MKKIFNLILPLIGILVYSCNPLDDTYSELEKNPALNVKTLNYVSLEKNEEIIPLWQQEEVAKSIAEIDNGTAVLEDWEVTRKRLFKKHNIEE